MPSNQDVNLKEVDALQGFSRKFGDFLGVMTTDLKKMLVSLQKIQDEFGKQLKKAQEQNEQAHKEAKAARNEWNNLMSQSERDPNDVRRCRQQLEHVEGHVLPLIRGYAEVSQSYASNANRDIYQMSELTSKYSARLTAMVEKGIKYLELAEEQVRNYKESQIGG